MRVLEPGAPSTPPTAAPRPPVRVGRRQRPLSLPQALNETYTPQTLNMDVFWQTEPPPLFVVAPPSDWSLSDAANLGVYLPTYRVAQVSHRYSTSYRPTQTAYDMDVIMWAWFELHVFSIHRSITRAAVRPADGCRATAQYHHAFRASVEKHKPTELVRRGKHMDHFNVILISPGSHTSSYVLTVHILVDC